MMVFFELFGLDFLVYVGLKFVVIEGCLIVIKILVIRVMVYFFIGICNCGINLLGSWVG